MKHWLLVATLICLGSTAQALNLSSRWGLDSGSIGGILTHDFNKSATVTGIQWDVVHISNGSDEIAEVGLFGGKRDVDAHAIFGPSFGTPGAGLNAIATYALNFVDWPILHEITQYGQYAHAYVNLGWDLAHPQGMKIKPDVIGLGGVLRFGH